MIEKAESKSTAEATEPRARNSVLFMHVQCLYERSGAGIARMAFPIRLILAPRDLRGAPRNFFGGISCTG